MKKVFKEKQTYSFQEYIAFGIGFILNAIIFLYYSDIASARYLALIPYAMGIACICTGSYKHFSNGKGIQSWLVENRISFFAVLTLIIGAILFYSHLIGYSSLEDILAESHGLLFDLIFFGIILAIYDSLRGKYTDTKKYKDELSDFKKWESEEASFRVAGLVKRLKSINATLTKKELDELHLGNCDRDFIDYALEELKVTPISLSKATLSNGDYSDLRLSKVKINDTLLTGSKFRSSNFMRTDFTRTNFFKSEFYHSDLSFSTLDHAHMKKILLEDCNLLGSTLKNSNLIGAKIINTYLHGVDLTGSNLSQSQFEHIDLSNSYGAEVNFSNSSFENSSLEEVNIKRSNFKNVNLSSTNFKNAKLSSSTFDNTLLTNCFFQGATCNQNSFKDSDLRGATLAGADFYQCNLENANLSGSNLIDTNFKDANLKGVNLENALVGSLDWFEQINLHGARGTSNFAKKYRVEKTSISNSTFIIKLLN